MSHVRDTQQELAILAMAQVVYADGSLNRRQLNQLSRASRRDVLKSWLDQQAVRRLSAALLNDIVEQSGPQAAPGTIDLAGGLHLIWNKARIWLQTTTATTSKAVQHTT